MPSDRYKLTLTIPFVRKLRMPWRRCNGQTKRWPHDCIASAYWEVKVLDHYTEVYCWNHLWQRLATLEKFQAWIRIRQMPHIHVETKVHRAQIQRRNDMEINIAAMTGTHGLGGEMALEAFDQASEEAWDRLSPADQGRVLRAGIAYLDRMKK